MANQLGAMRRDRSFRRLLVLLLLANLATTGILGVSLYLRAERSAREQALESNRLVLRQLNRSVDAVLNEFDKSFATLILDFSVAGFLDYYRNGDYLMMSRVYENLRGFLAVNRAVNSLHIYYRDGDLVLSPHHGVTPAASYYDRDLVRRVLEGAQPAGWMDVRMAPDAFTGLPVRVLTVVKPIPLVFYSPKALIVVTLREQFLSEMVGSIQATGEGSVFVVTGSGAVLGSAPDEGQKAIAARVASAPRDPAGGMFLTGSAADRTLVSSMPSTRYPWTYVCALPYRSVVSGIDALRLWWVAAVLATVLLGIAVSLVISRASYAVVAKLAARFTRGAPEPGTRDLVGYIGNGIDALRQRASEAEALLEGAKPGLRNAFFLRLLKGNTDRRDALAERSDYYGLRAHACPRLAVLLVRPDAEEEFRLRYTEHERNLLSVRFPPLVSAILPVGAVADVLDDDSMEIRILLGLRGGAEGADGPGCGMALAFARGLQEGAAKLLVHPVTVGLSGLHGGLGELHLAYREAVRAIQYSIVLGGNRVISQADLPSPTDTPFEYPFLEERKLLDGLRGGDIALAERHLDRILPGGEEARPSSPHQARFAEIRLLCSILSFLADIGGVTALFPEGDPFSGLLRQGTPRESRDLFLALFRRIQSFIEESRRERNGRLVRGVEGYVLANYQDRELSLVRIAEAVFYSVPHVCRVFREATGVSVKEFINGVRIDRAKELLADPGLSVSDVAHGVGYDRLQSFIKLFKKRLGLTPGDFRRVLAARGSETDVMIGK